MSAVAIFGRNSGVWPCNVFDKHKLISDIHACQCGSRLVWSVCVCMYATRSSAGQFRLAFHISWKWRRGGWESSVTAVRDWIQTCCLPQMSTTFYTTELCAEVLRILREYWRLSCQQMCTQRGNLFLARFCTFMWTWTSFLVEPQVAWWKTYFQFFLAVLQKQTKSLGPFWGQSQALKYATVPMHSHWKHFLY